MPAPKWGTWSTSAGEECELHGTQTTGPLLYDGVFPEAKITHRICSECLLDVVHDNLDYVCID